jgi:uncharacterized membrane protein YkvA (DUF1232 family)
MERSEAENPPAGNSATPDSQAADETPEILERFKVTARRLPRYLRLAANLLRDDEVPLEAKTALIFGGAYVVSPFDLIPGVIPVLGQLDDLLVMLLGLRFTLALCPDEVAERHLGEVSLTRADISDDLKTVRDTVVYLGRRALHGASKLATRGWRSSVMLVRRGWGRLRSETPAD